MVTTKLINIVCLTLFVLSACTQKDQISVGWIGPLSADYALVGRENLRGVQLALDELPAGAIQLLVEDDQYDETETLSAYQKLVGTQDADALLLVTYGGVLSTAPLADAEQKIIVSSVDTSDEIAKAGENIFGIGIYDEGIGYALADFTTQKLNATKIGVLYNNVDPFVLLVLDSFKNRVGENTTVLTEAYQPEDRDFRSQLAKLKKVDALLIIGFDEAGLAAKQAREVGITTPLLGIDTVLSEGYKTNAADAYEGMYFTSWTPSDKEKTKQFVKQYKSKFGEEPQQLLFAATGYDAAKQLFLALLENRATAKKQLSSLHTKGLTGELSMSPDGIVRSVEEKMHQIQMGQVVELS